MTAATEQDAIAELAAKHEQFPSLDSLRALGSLAVLCTHVAFWSGFYPRGTLGTMSARLDVGVAVFFVLSGFLLSRPFLRAWRDRSPRPSTGRYLWKRAIRVLPMAWLVTVGALILLPENSDAGAGAWIRNLTLTQLYASDGLPAGLTHLWSLATEVAFYLALPVLMAGLLVVRRHRSPTWPLLLCTALMTGNLVWLAWFADLTSTASQWLPGHLGWFAGGIALAIVQLWPDWRARPAAALRDLAAQPGACWTIAAAAFLVASTPLAGPASLEPATNDQLLTKSLLYLVVALLVVMPSALHPHDRGRYHRVMSSRPMRRLGLISYSIFCVHLMVLHGVAWWRDIDVFAGHGTELLLLTVLGTLVVSEVTYRLIERPAMRLRNLGTRAPVKPTTAPNDTSTSH